MRARLISEKITYPCGCAFGVIEGGHIGFAPCCQNCPNFADACQIAARANKPMLDLRDHALKAQQKPTEP